MIMMIINMDYKDEEEDNNEKNGDNKGVYMVPMFLGHGIPGGVYGSSTFQITMIIWIIRTRRKRRIMRTMAIIRLCM